MPRMSTGSVEAEIMHGNITFIYVNGPNVSEIAFRKKHRRTIRRESETLRSGLSRWRGGRTGYARTSQVAVVAVVSRCKSAGWEFVYSARGLADGRPMGRAMTLRSTILAVRRDECTDIRWKYGKVGSEVGRSTPIRVG